MSVENPSSREEEKPEAVEIIEKRGNILETRDLYKEHATELQKEVAEIHVAKLETTLYRLMSRTGDNPDLVNGLNELLNSLDHQSTFGDSEKPLTDSRQKDLANFLVESTKALRWTVGGGNRPADLKVDLSKWETK